MPKCLPKYVFNNVPMLHAETISLHNNDQQTEKNIAQKKYILRTDSATQGRGGPIDIYI